MKVSSRSVNNAVFGIDRLINSIPIRTQQTVKSLFYLVLFGLTIGGAVLGAIQGKDAAKIKSSPIIENTNDAFEIDIKREREGGNYASMLDTEVINEMKKIDKDKIQFPSRSNLEPETDRGIIEPESPRKVRPSPDVTVQDPLFEGDYRSKRGIDSDVRPIEKPGGPSSEDHESIVESEKKEIEPLHNWKSEAGSDAERRRTQDKLLEKKKPVRGSDIRSPEPAHYDDGIIDN